MVSTPVDNCVEKLPEVNTGVSLAVTVYVLSHNQVGVIVRVQRGSGSASME